MKYIAKLTLLVIAFSLLPAGGVFAHTLKVDGDIGITVHISPEDEPVSNRPAQIHVSIKDRSGQFAQQASNCICTLTITGGASEAAEKSFTPDTTGQAVVGHTFPSGGTYELRIQGASVGAKPFQPFDVAFVYRVAADGSSNNTQPPLTAQPLKQYLPIVIILAAAAIIILALAPLPSKQS